MGKFIYRMTILMLLVIGCFHLMLQSKSVKDHFSNMLSEKTGHSLTIKDWSLTYPFTLQINSLEFASPHIEVNNLFCRINLFSFLSKKWVINTLVIDEMALDEGFPSEGKSPFPPSLEISKFQVKTLRVKEYSFSLEGGVKWNPQEPFLTGVVHWNDNPIHLTLSKQNFWHFFAISSQGSIEADFFLEEDLIRLKQVSLLSDLLTLKGAGKINTGDHSIAASFNISTFEQQIPFELSGFLSSPAIKAKYNDLEFTAKAQYAGGKLNASLSLTSPQFETVNLETELFTSAKLWPYSLTYHTKKANLQSEGAWKFDWSGVALYIDSLSGDYGGFPFALNDTAMIRNRECSPLFFTFANGTIYTTIDYIGDNIHTTTRAKNLPSELFELWLPPLPFTSSVDIEAFLYGSPKSLNGQIQLDLERMKVLDETYVKLPPLQAHCRATIKEEKLECTGTIIGAGPYPMTLSASLPFKCQLWPPKLTIDQKSPAQAEITASGEISPYLHLFFSDTTNITGEAAIALSMEGTLENPQLAGELTLENGTFESYTLGTTFENISAKIIGRGSQVHLAKFSAETNRIRTVNATGSMALDANQNYPFAITINTHHTPLIQLDLASMITSGQLMLQGNLNEAALSGDLKIERADFELPKQLSQSIKEVEITYINQPEHEEPPTTFKISQEIFPVSLDIRLHALRGINLTGKDLSMEWRGETFIKGTASSPQLFGQVEAIKGEQLINGKMFSLKQGNITFSGNYSDKASLYVIAEHEIDDISAEIVLKGPVNNPLISFRSNPPLSQPEILSLILFNKALPEITSLQGTELTQTFSALNSAGDDADILGKLRKAIGIDRLEFSHSDTHGQNDFSLKVGKYVTPGILVLVNKSMTSDAKSLTISANLIKSVKLQAEIDEDANSHLLLKWKHDY